MRTGSPLERISARRLLSHCSILGRHPTARTSATVQSYLWPAEAPSIQRRQAIKRRQLRGAIGPAGQRSEDWSKGRVHNSAGAPHSFSSSPILFLLLLVVVLLYCVKTINTCFYSLCHFTAQSCQCLLFFKLKNIPLGLVR